MCVQMFFYVGFPNAQFVLKLGFSALFVNVLLEVLRERWNKFSHDLGYMLI